MIDEENDELKLYRNTYYLYKDIKKYLSREFQGKPRITKDTPFPIVTVWVNKCIKSFKNKNKPKEKVLQLCFYYLDSIGYKFN